jgi:DNA-binding NarL/FixJ family response regulator
MSMTCPLPDNPEGRLIVLVVDDVPASLGALYETLEAAGYIVLVACDGYTALQRLARVMPDAILLDAMMPGISGFDTCRRIKADPATRHLPVIFMTGLSETAHVLEGFACGGVDYVVKPVDASEVLARLHTHLGNARAFRSAQVAINAYGLGVIMINDEGIVSWKSSYAIELLMHYGIEPESTTIPSAWWSKEPGTVTISITDQPTARSLVVRNMGAAGVNETMLLIESKNSLDILPDRLASAALTPREIEVLSWLAKGKTNRDIGDILDRSPRTVNKHLEHIFEKLGVETRSAAVNVWSCLRGGAADMPIETLYSPNHRNTLRPAIRPLAKQAVNK